MVATEDADPVVEFAPQCSISRRASWRQKGTVQKANHLDFRVLKKKNWEKGREKKLGFLEYRVCGF